MIDNVELGKRIKEKRREKKLSQESLSDKIGVGTTHISHIETGNSMPSLPVFIKLVEVLECSADDLLRD